MAAKKKARKLDKKSMKKTKGGILIGMLVPAVQKVSLAKPTLSAGSTAVPPTPCI